MSGNWHKRGNLRGANGVGVPEGGQPGQMLQKVGSSDYATGWAFPEYKDILGKVPKSALPDIGNSTQVVNSESAMLNLPAVAGNMVIRTDLGKTFVLAEEPANVLENWVELVTSSDVQSVNGQTGNVTLTKADVGLSKVNNTADADKPVATTSVNGLMPKADKAALANATSGPVNNTLAKRDAAGRISFRQVTISDAPTASSQTATKGYTDDLFGTLAGGSVLSNTDWDAMRTTASTGVVEGWVKGCPVGGKVSDGTSAGFVKDPVWRLEVRPEGLDYVTQKATLFNCVPRYMIGFVWERIYNPATAKWSAWTCIGGDTGDLKSSSSNIASLTAEQPFRHQTGSTTYLYTPDQPYTVRRVGGTVHLHGTAGSKAAGLSRESISSGTTAPIIMWFGLSDKVGAGVPGSDYTVAPYNIEVFGVMPASYKNRWVLAPASNKYEIYGYRYGPEGDRIPERGVWLPFNTSYEARPLNTYTGPGFVPPVVPAQGETGND